MTSEMSCLLPTRREENPTSPSVLTTSLTYSQVHVHVYIHWTFFTIEKLSSLFLLHSQVRRQSLFKGKLVTCTVVGIVCRKPPREVLDRAHPIENKATGYWQCPFCLKADFRELSMVRTCTTTRLADVWCRECEIYKHKQSKHNHVTKNAISLPHVLPLSGVAAL